ncbi:ankyrin repeat domain-containing protein [Vibrio ouci]|uniref:ankyrin repeat domain-containing protein n=1 Tax=Vibrio ouci TaxID=2499078 RepID=UPI00142E426C|nr:ankyrin repeat domain-containing protein [Vibrio ouci]
MNQEYLIVNVRIIKQLFLFAILLASCNLAYPLEVFIGDMNEGELKEVAWKGRPVYVYKRTDYEISSLMGIELLNSKKRYEDTLARNAKITSNEYASLLSESSSIEMTPLRSYKEKYLVVVGTEPWNGCLVFLKSRKFHDPCEDDYYDLAGRLINPDRKASYHLMIPPHSIDGEVITFRESPSKVKDYSPEILLLPISDGNKLFESIQWRKWELAQNLISKTPDIVNYKSPNGATSLHLGAWRGDVAFLRYLLESGASINKLTDEGLGAIHFALLARNIDNAKFLIKQGAKIENYCINSACVPNIEEYVERTYPYYDDVEIKELVELLRSQ